MAVAVHLTATAAPIVKTDVRNEFLILQVKKKEEASHCYAESADFQPASPILSIPDSRRAFNLPSMQKQPLKLLIFNS